MAVKPHWMRPYLMLITPSSEADNGERYYMIYPFEPSIAADATDNCRASGDIGVIRMGHTSMSPAKVAEKSAAQLSAIHQPETFELSSEPFCRPRPHKDAMLHHFII